MRILGLSLMAFALAFGARADDDDLLNEATLRALESARASLASAEKVSAAGVKRIGVASLDDTAGDASAKVTPLVKSALVKTDFDVVLTSDADWGALLDEFARQVKREDLMVKETAHDLRVQGVDAVLFGTVEKYAAAPFEAEGQSGHRATVRLLLNLASLAEENPGSLLWSEQVTGNAEMAEAVAPPPFEERTISIFVQYRIVFGVAAVLAALLLASRMFKRATTPR